MEAFGELALPGDTTVFELSTIFLAIRNLAICYSLHEGTSPVFSRRAFERLGRRSLLLDSRCTEVLENARILSTRGRGAKPPQDDVDRVLSSRPVIDKWVTALVAG
jgi:hypothetical protein